jgi:hypothetical protein
LLVYCHLALRAGAAWIIEQGAQIVHFLAAAQVVKHIIDEIEHLADGVAHTQAAVTREINYVGIQTIAHGAPLVLLDQVTRDDGRAQIMMIKPG